jgi:DNA modification methylase/sporulation protein YlmC with PRC-barrel domain
LKLSALTPDKRNANKGTERGRKMVRESLKRYGTGRSILLDKSGNIIAGNKTVEGAQAVGFEDVQIVKSDGTKLIAVQRTDLDINDRKARELAIADNRASELGLEWDTDVLKQFETEEVDLSPFWDERELVQFFARLSGEAPEPRIDQAAELCKKWATETGQLWLIGPHRLLCGDSTSEADVARLWAGQGERGALLATDPPYGVGYGMESGPDSAQRFGSMGNDEADGPRLQGFLEKAFLAALPYLRENAAWYLWHAQLTQGFFAAAAAAAAQLLVHRQIIWAKHHFILGHGDYHWQHELCFYGWRTGRRAPWYGGRDQATIWDIDRPMAATTHPTEKPTEIFARSMRNNTQAGEICYEPFAGSGTQVCAAETEKRVCYAIEIEPKYVAVALERLSDMGLKPELQHA